ncbi:MAG: class I SAM-dependent methyltransferase [Myxococcota bacterium]
MEHFYTLATVDYRYLAESRNWAQWFLERQNPGRTLRLLDVACGSGKFPRALAAHADLAGVADVNYALLDPSPFSIAETKRVLPPPFIAGAEYEETLQDLSAPAGAFDVVWATHALYALPASELELGMKKFAEAISPGGSGFIAHSTATGHYVAFYRDFLADFRNGTPYTSAEQIVEALSGLGVNFSTEVIEYTNGAPLEEYGVIEGYLQRCAFDDSVSLEQMLDAPTTGKRLAEARGSDAWAFKQQVMLISIDGP